jgi:FtsP/CotA-like multicopper oxidase with cupredoxin domain
LNPVLTVDRGACRVRLLNGSNARLYKLAWSDRSPMTVIGGDGGLLEKARKQPSLVLAPGQRADVFLDLSGQRSGSRLKLISQAFAVEDAGRMGMMEESSPVPQGAELELMTLQVSGRRGPEMRLPASLSRHDFTPRPKAKVRPVPLNFMRMAWLLDGRTFDMQDVAEEETVEAGSTWIWEFENQANPMGMAMAHPIHVHGPQFRVLERSGGSKKNSLREGLVDDGWIDTVLVLPGEKVRVQIQFSRHPGLYLYHCHILEHEDMGMMRNFRITAPA